MNGILHRVKYHSEQTEGDFKLYDGEHCVFSCVTLELGWKDNQEGISCIPKGSYKAVPRISARFGQHYQVLLPNRSEIPGRTWILIHPGNFKTDIRGCILFGREHIDLNADGFLDVTASGPTLERLLGIAPEGFDFEITGEH